MYEAEIPLNQIVESLQECFARFACHDASNNGLQIEGNSMVHKLGFAVDASLQTFEQAAENHVDFLFVHHGLSWRNGFAYLRGMDARRVNVLLRNGISLYGCHLPLDAHDTLGNNAQLAQLLGMDSHFPFAEYGGLAIGRYGELPSPRTPEEIVSDCRTAGVPVASHAVWFPSGMSSVSVRSLGIISGSGVSPEILQECREKRLDALLTGEVSHADVHVIRESGVPVIQIGHYASETTGVRAVMEELSEKFHLPCDFLDVPTGL